MINPLAIPAYLLVFALGFLVSHYMWSRDAAKKKKEKERKSKDERIFILCFSAARSRRDGLDLITTRRHQAIKLTTFWLGKITQADENNWLAMCKNAFPPDDGWQDHHVLGKEIFQD